MFAHKTVVTDYKPVLQRKCYALHKCCYYCVATSAITAILIVVVVVVEQTGSSGNAADLHSESRPGRRLS
jgi:hypothetical protein